MRQFTSQKRNLEEDDINLIGRLFPEMGMYNESALQLPPHVGINKNINLAFYYGHKTVHYVNMNQRGL